eukprot:Gb_02907 [translate_table: standard]
MQWYQSHVLGLVGEHQQWHHSPVLVDDKLRTEIALCIKKAIRSPLEEIRVAIGCRRPQDRRRAKAYANLLAKKVVKYARREDAILHALGLEKNQLKQKEQSSCPEAVHLEENKCGDVANQSQVCVPGSYKNDCEHNFEDYSNLLEPDSPLDALRGPDWEDDGTEGTTQMRDPQEDFGLRIVPQKNHFIMAAQCEGIPNVIVPENGVHCPPYTGRGMGCGSPANSSKVSSLTLERKRSQFRASLIVI